MSVALAWLIANAQQVSAISEETIWVLSKRYSPVELSINLACLQHKVYGQGFWCIAENEFWMVSQMGGQQFVSAFKTSSTLQPPPQESRWFGREVKQYHIDQYTIVSYSSSFSADALARSYRLHNSRHIAFYREIEHGKYHMATQSPQSDIFIIQQGRETYTFIIQAERPELD